MKLTAVETTNYKSIENAGKVEIDEAATAMVGKNESGKTAWLQALRRLNPVDDAEYNPTRHYPRRRLVKYKKRHEAEPDDVVVATY